MPSLPLPVPPLPLNATTMESATRPALQSRMPEIATILRNLGRMIPDEELRNVPKDLASQVDHYVYGTPKR